MNIHSYSNNANYTNSPYGQTNGFNPAVFNTANTPPIDFGQQQRNELLQQRLAEGSQRQQSPPFQNPAFNVNSVVPAKRPRPSNDDGSSSSPRPMPGHLGSRSQTPQQISQPSSFPSHMGANPYQHLRNGSTNGASPSPRPPSNPFNPTGTSHQSNTQSPRMSNSQGLQGNSYQNAQARVNMPQSGFNSAIGGGNIGNTMPGGHNMSPEAMREVAQQQQRYRMLEMQQRQMQAANPGLQQNRSNMAGVNQTPGMPNMQNAMHAASRPMASQQAQNAGPYEQQFMMSLTKYLANKGQALEPDPTVSGRAINYMQLFNLVTNSRILLPGANANNWALVASQMGFPQPQFATAPEELEGIFSRNLRGFVQVWFQSMQKRKMQQMQQRSPGSVGSGRPAPQGSPISAQQPQGQALQQTSGPDQSPPLSHQAPGFSLQRPPAMRSASPVQAVGLHQAQAADRERVTREQPPSRQASNHTIAGIDQALGQQHNSDRRALSIDQQPETAPGEAIKPSQLLQGPPSQPNDETYHPRKRFFPATDECYGGLPTDQLALLGERLTKAKPGVPLLQEMGAVDIHALTMSLRSGFHGEMRYALDQLVGLSHDFRVNFALEDCEGLLEALVECGEDQLDRLAENCAALDDVEYPNFERLSRSSRKESQDLRCDPPFASLDYELERAADRLIAVTTILRNLSIPDLLKNHDMLLQVCVSFVALAIRMVGNRPKILRTNRNLVDFMKDLVTFLANLSHRLEIPSKEDANALLHFLVAFGPENSPLIDTKTSRLAFQPYDPRRHQYLPSAIDALAKLFARDEPNRSLYKSLLSEDRPTTSSGIPLLTRAFALAVAPIPDRLSPHLSPERGDLVRISQERNHFFTQGMLAGDILSTLIPASDNVTARSWLDAENAWATSLMHLLTQLGFERNTNVQIRHHGRAEDFEGGGCSLISQRGFSMLKRLCERLDKRGRNNALVEVRPDRQVVLKALSSQGYEAGTLRHLVAFVGLDG